MAATPSASDPGFQAALAEAKKGAAEGGVPIGACLVDKNGNVLGQGHNLRVQRCSATLHAEISALETAGRLPASAYHGATMYTTLSPCDMCTGACIMYKVSRVVLGENNSFIGGEKYLRERGIEVVNLQHAECETLMTKFIKEHPEDW
ncbi:cytidine deaminase-like protein [Teratosphaeria nubilosa]|uniref:Cytosine deaminase n=1 Tax=Teratosphaeria nubilosa TaxID=161662 RepID=A0A6G1KV78_9PEZI|nr:cytidine deaminase-like protein [Teratosphaeria nubilosa]